MGWTVSCKFPDCYSRNLIFHREDVLLLDADDYIIVVLAGCPAAKEWPAVIQGAEEVLEQAWTIANDTQVQSILDQCKTRGTHAITTGFAYGGGRTVC